MTAWLGRVAVVLTACSLGCARTGASSQEAFETAKNAPGSDPSGKAAEEAAAQAPDRFARGWERVGAIVQLGARELAAGDPARVLGLADRWCASAPTPQQTPHGPVVVCFPAPPIQAGGHGFTLEMGDGGMVGLVSSSLTGTESQRLAGEARREGDAWCVEPWRPVASPEHAFQEFHSCPVEGGAILTIGRLPRDLDADLWQVSVTLLGAT